MKKIYLYIILTLVFCNVGFADSLRVVDGDTVDVLIDVGFSTFRKERVRLYGINTPETRTRDLEEKARGFAAKEYLEKRIDDYEREIIIKTELDNKGKFGRILGILYSPDQEKNLNEELLQEGHAEEYFGGSR